MTISKLFTLLFTTTLLLVQDRPRTFLGADGITLQYTEVGTGTPIVLLSGGPGFSSGYLKPLADRLALHYRSILLDQRGTGGSRLEVYNVSTINLANSLADLEHLRQALRTDHFVLAGHSWGGMLAMAYASRYPDRLTGLVLIGSGGPTLDFMWTFSQNIDARLTAADRQRRAYWLDPERAAANPRRSVLEVIKTSWLAYFFDREQASTFAASVTEDDYEDRVFELMMQDLRETRYDLRPALKTLRIPTLVIQGREDPIADAEILNDAIPGSQLSLIDHAGHFPWIEQPERFYPIVLDFLKNLSPSARTRVPN